MGQGGERVLEESSSERRCFIWFLLVGMLLALAVLFPTSGERIFAQTGGYGYRGGGGGGGGGFDDDLPLGTLTLSPTSGPVGTEVTVKGSRFDPDEALLIIFESTPVVVGSTVVDRRGNFFDPVVFKVPKDATVGVHSVTAENVDTEEIRGSAKFTVTTVSAASPAPPGALRAVGSSANGFNRTPFMLLASSLLVLGFVLFRQSTRNSD